MVISMANYTHLRGSILFYAHSTRAHNVFRKSCAEYGNWHSVRESLPRNLVLDVLMSSASLDRIPAGRCEHEGWVQDTHINKDGVVSFSCSLTNEEQTIQKFIYWLSTKSAVAFRLETRNEYFDSIPDVWYKNVWMLDKQYSGLPEYAHNRASGNFDETDAVLRIKGQSNQLAATKFIERIYEHDVGYDGTERIAILRHPTIIDSYAEIQVDELASLFEPPQFLMNRNLETLSLKNWRK